MTRTSPAMLALAFAVALGLIFTAPSALAVNPDEVLSDPVLEKRARAISKGLRCLVCQNQSIDESDADLARDLRVLVRVRLVAGNSDTEVVEYVVSRYGDFVLLNPPFKAATLILWLGPALIALGGLIALFFTFRRHARPAGNVPAAAGAPGAAGAGAPLSGDEKRRIAALLKSDGD